MLFLNLLLLLSVVIIPFPTSVLATDLRSSTDEAVAAAFYAATMFAMGCCFAATWVYTSRHPELLEEPMSPRETRVLIRRNVVGEGAYLVAFGLAFVSAPASLALCGLVAIYYVLPGRLPARSSAAT
jgi:uncharacterized membrane protein